MTVDLDRDILEIKYNILNLPDKVTFKSGDIIVNLYREKELKPENDLL